MPLGLALICLVVGISDGDTLTAKCSTNDQAHPYRQVKVRLAEIDAPESGQAFGQRSKQHLSDLCFQVEAAIQPTDTDRYGRMVGRVECRGKDANLEMVRAGMAWAYTQYQTDPAFSVTQRQAQSSRRGLWADPHAVAPWEYRRNPQPPQKDATGCFTGPRGGRYKIRNGRKRYDLC